MDTNGDLETRIQTLEEIAAHQARLLEELDRAVYEIRTTLDRIESLQRRQEERLTSISRTSGESAPADDPPPHY